MPYRKLPGQELTLECLSKSLDTAQEFKLFLKFPTTFKDDFAKPK